MSSGSQRAGSGLAGGAPVCPDLERRQAAEDDVVGLLGQLVRYGIVLGPAQQVFGQELLQLRLDLPGLTHHRSTEPLRDCTLCPGASACLSTCAITGRHVLHEL